MSDTDSEDLAMLAERHADVVPYYASVLRRIPNHYTRSEFEEVHRHADNLLLCALMDLGAHEIAKAYQDVAEELGFKYA